MIGKDNGLEFECCFWIVKRGEINTKDGVATANWKQKYLPFTWQDENRN